MCHVSHVTCHVSSCSLLTPLLYTVGWLAKNTTTKNEKQIHDWFQEFGLKPLEFEYCCSETLKHHILTSCLLQTNCPCASTQLSSLRLVSIMVWLLAKFTWRPCLG